MVAEPFGFIAAPLILMLYEAIRQNRCPRRRTA